MLLTPTIVSTKYDPLQQKLKDTTYYIIITCMSRVDKCGNKFKYTSKRVVINNHICNQCPGNNIKFHYVWFQVA